MRLTIRRPDDMHLHVRDGMIMDRVVRASAAVFGRAIIMPNLVPPVTTGEAALAYRRRILDALPESSSFQPLMTIYLTDDTDPREVRDSIDRGSIAAVKLYPAGATTNSDSGVTDVARIRDVLSVLAETGTPLCVHGEVTDPGIDIFDRERVFIETVLEKIRSWEPRLRVVIEHVTTAEGVGYVRDYRPFVAATITVHHLILNRNDLFRGGIRPHYYCLPIAKRERHRLAVLEAATSGEDGFFLGTDSAPHLASSKECPVGCAGIYSAPVAMPCLAHVFESAGALDRLESFASLQGCAFYGLPPASDCIELEKSAEPLPSDRLVSVEDGWIVEFEPGFDLYWRVAGEECEQDG